MDLFPVLFEEYDLSGAPGLAEFKQHIKSSGKHDVHSLAVGGVSSHGGWDPLRDPKSEPILIAFQQCVNHYADKVGNYPCVISGSWYNILPHGENLDESEAMLNEHTKELESAMLPDYDSNVVVKMLSDIYKNLLLKRKYERIQGALIQGVDVS